jgi:hypothetical protein
MKSLLKMAIVATGVYFVFKYLDERKKGTDSTGAIKKAISDSQSDASLIVNDIKCCYTRSNRCPR